MNAQPSISGLFLEFARRTGMDSTMYGTLYVVLSRSWCKETASPSFQEAWASKHPSSGQCAVTALVVQDLVGGDIIRTVVPEYGSHYFNRLPNGEDYADYDLTKLQFADWTPVPPGAPADRAAMLDSDRAKEFRTRERYELLRQRAIDVMNAR